MIAGLIGGGVAVALAVDSGGAPSSGGYAVSPGGPIAFVSTVSSSPPIAASAALHRVVDSLKRSDIVSARIDMSAGHGVPSVENAAVPALYVRVKIPGTKGADMMEALWQAELLTGAVVQLAGSHRSLQNDVGYIYFSGQFPDGKVFPGGLGGAMGYIARGQQFAGSNDTDAEIRDSIDRRASALGLTVDNVTIFRALGAAPAVVLTAPDIRAAAANYESLAEKLFGSTPRYEGYYLEIRGKDGKPYVWRSISYLTGVGSTWIDPSIGGQGTGADR